jgi:tetraacyldisaccharide-1-P 4'-kinase
VRSTSLNLRVIHFEVYASNPTKESNKYGVAYLLADVRLELLIIDDGFQHVGLMFGHIVFIIMPHYVIKNNIY